MAQVCRLERTTTRRGQTVIEEEYAITSVSPRLAGPDQLLRWWQDHWHIENRLHWVRDVTLGEDGCRVRCGTAPHALACFRNAALNLLRLLGASNIAAELRQHTYQPHLLLARLGIMTN